LYLGSILFYLGLIITTALPFSLVVLSAIMLFYNYIAGYEQRLLDARYGEEYRLSALAHPQKNVDIELWTYDRLQQVNGVSNYGSHTVAPSNPMNRLQCCLWR